MFDVVIHFIESIRLQYWMYICLGIIAGFFLLGAFLSLASGDAVKFKSAAKRALKASMPDGLEKNKQFLPLKIRKLYNDAKKSKLKPSEVVTLDACVNAPFSAGVAGRFGGAVMAASLLSVALMFVVGLVITKAQSVNGYAATAVVIVAAMVLRLLAGLIGTGVHKSCIRTYVLYAEALDKTLNSDYEANAALTKSGVGDNNKASLVSDRSASEIVGEETSASFVAAKPKEGEDALGLMAREEQHGHPSEAAAPLVLPLHVPKANSADEVVARIERISREGATVATMREVAFALQQERAKPENKTPDRQKKLNEALAMLLKAMTAAQKK